MKYKKTMRVGIVVSILAVGFLGMNLLGSADKKSNKRETKPDIRTVTVNDIETKDITLQINGNGVIESKRSLSIVSEVNGKVVFANNDLKSGTFVRKGETIVKVDSREISNELMSLRSDLMNAVASILPEYKIEEDKAYEKWFNYFQNLDINKEIAELPEIVDAQEKIKVSSRNIFTKYCWFGFIQLIYRECCNSFVYCGIDIRTVSCHKIWDLRCFQKSFCNILRVFRGIGKV